jgi:transposase
MPARRSTAASGICWSTRWGCSSRPSYIAPTFRIATTPRCCALPCAALRHVFADGGYAGGKLRQALAKLGTWTLDIVRRSDAAKGFQPLSRRWVVERTIAWLNRNRRLAKDFEATIESAQAWLFIASVKLLSRRIARA